MLSGQVRGSSVHGAPGGHRSAPRGRAELSADVPGAGRQGPPPLQPAGLLQRHRRAGAGPTGQEVTLHHPRLSTAAQLQVQQLRRRAAHRHRLGNHLLRQVPLLGGKSGICNNICPLVRPKQVFCVVVSMGLLLHCDLKIHCALSFPKGNSISFLQP